MDVNQDPNAYTVPVANAGLADNAAGALAYLTIIPAIIFLVMEPYNKRPFVRFHAFQSIALGVIAFVLFFFMVIPIIGWILVPLAELALMLVWIFCVVQAYQGKLFKLPVLGSFVEGLAK